MPITRVQVEQVLLDRCGKKLAIVGLDAAPDGGARPGLSDPIASALAALNVPVADFSRVADGDLAALVPGQIPALLDLAEVRALESVLGNWDECDQQADTNNQQMLGKLYDSIERTVARKRLQLERQYGFGAAELAAGVLDLGFAETVDPATGRAR